MTTATDILANDHAQLQSLAHKTFLITGGNGMLGRAFRGQIERLLPEATIHCLDKTQLDVRSPEAFAPYEAIRPDFVIHCAALVDADHCESFPEEGEISIVGGTKNVVAYAQRCGAKVLYPQSFLIYQDTHSTITEQTEPQPLSVYGRLKLAAESYVLAHANNALSVRMGGFFGGEAADNNFVGRIVPHLAKLIRQGTTSQEIGNRVWQPTFTNDLAANCLLLLAAECQGVYCMASSGSASFYELTVEIVKQLELADKIEIKCVDASVVAKKEKALRPVSAIMHNARLEAESLNRQRDWRESLAVYLNQPFFKSLFP